MILIDSYGWLEYFLEGSLAEKYAKYVEEANEENYVTHTIVLYEVFNRIRSTQGEQSAIEAYFCSKDGAYTITALDPTKR